MKYLIFVFIFFLSFDNFCYSQTYDNTNYDIKYHCFKWEIDPEIYYIKGSVLSYFKVIDDSKQIVFELTNELKVDSVIYNFNKIDYLHNENHLVIIFSEILPQNSFQTLIIYYQGEPSEINSRAFILDEHDNEPIMWTLSEPMGAKDWFPCKQTLNDKIDSIDIFITTPVQYKVAGNGILISETILDNLKTTHWKHNFPIAAYLIGIAITNYVEYSDYVCFENNDSLQILNYVYPEDIDYAKENTPNIINVVKYFDKNFLPYPFERYGHAQFNFGGGMEHQTMSFMVNFSHPLLAHELAHQWFGNYITCGSWHDIWLNESFATYLDGLTTEQKLRDENWVDWKRKQISDITSLPNGSVYITDTSSYKTIFNHRLVYSKGAMVLNIIRNEIGDSLFFLTVKNYLNDPKLAYNYALTNDLKNHFENTTKIDFTNFFDDWIYGEGYPIYKIKWMQNKDNLTKIIVNQTQTDISVDFFELKIPILLKGKKQDTLLILNNLYNNQEFEFDIDFNIKSAVFDPHSNIITKGSQISEFFIYSKNFSFEINPNPANQELEIEFPIELKLNSIEIYDEAGKSVFIKKTNYFGKIYNLDISNLNSGVYIVYIETDSQILSKKIIVLK